MFLSQTPKAMPSAVPDPDLEIRGGAPLSRLLDKKGKGVGRTAEELFSALRASVWSKNDGGGGRPPRAPPLDPPLVCSPNYITGFFFLLFQHGQHLLLLA